jgi:hypothetical protein
MSDIVNAALNQSCLLCAIERRALATNTAMAFGAYMGAFIGAQFPGPESLKVLAIARCTAHEAAWQEALQRAHDAVLQDNRDRERCKTEKVAP